MSGMIISPAMLKIIEECPRKYFYMYVDKISLPQNKKLFEKGKNIHAIASYFIKNFDVSKLENALTNEEKDIWKYLKNTKYFGYEFINSEYQISFKLDDNWFGGRLDALVKNKEDYYILDYKTGAIPKNPEFDFQTMIYLLAVDRLLNRKYKSLNFVYLDLKNKDEKIINFSDDFKQKYEENLKKVAKKIEISQSFQKISNQGNKCNCDYYKFCKIL